MARIAVRWLKSPCLRYFDDFGMVTTESAVQGTLAGFTALNEILAFELKIKKSRWGGRNSNLLE